MVASPVKQNFEDRLPPHNIEAECAVIGALLLDPSALQRVEATLQPDDFYSLQMRTIYQAAIALGKKDTPCDLMQVTNFLRSNGALEKAGGQSQLFQLFDGAVTSANIDQHAALIAEKARRRQLIGLGHECMKLAYAQGEDWRDVYEQVEARLHQLGGVDTSDLVPLSETVDEVLSEIEALSNGEKLPGVPTGFYDLDAMTQGFQPGQLIITAARPSMGKTAILLQWLSFIAASNVPVLLFSMEMGARELTYRMLSSVSGLQTSQLRMGRIAENDWQSVGNGIERLSNLPFYIVDQPNLTAADIRSKARHFQAQHGRPGLIGIDYLQLMGEGGSNRVTELGQITRSLKGLARELDCPINVLSQLSRGVESRTNKRPMMSDLRESGALEQDADLIMMLYRDEYYDPDTPDRGIAELIITKQRNGPTGTVKLLFEPQYTRFRNLARHA